MIEQLDFLAEKYHTLNEQIADPAIIADQANWQKLMKEHAHLEPILDKYNEYKKVLADIEENEEIVRDKDMDPELKELAEEELKELKPQVEVLENELKLLLIPRDPNDDRNVIVEIRGGAGGDEAALFAADLFRMYTRYAERHKFKTEILSSNILDLGGIKEITFLIKGDGAYSRLKFESGVHRVQRIPSTESGGRIHTSTATVAVLPEVDDVEVQIDPNDLRIDVYRSSGNGGQSVNTTDSAVRITHLPLSLIHI